MSRKRYWAIVPAAGIGRRMGSDVPKQYLPLLGQSVIEHTLQRLSQVTPISEIVVVLAKDDPYWPELRLEGIATSVVTVVGGDERCDSVLNGLQALHNKAEEHDWVLVHDAARPCVRPEDIQQLIRHCEATDFASQGAILAMPVRDTMKQSDEQACIAHSLQREHIWHALTPQMFPVTTLRKALTAALASGVTVTDEAMAMEAAGYRACLVQGHSDNIKITNPEDLALAEFYLQQQQFHGIAVFDDGMSDGG